MSRSDGRRERGRRGRRFAPAAPAVILAAALAAAAAGQTARPSAPIPDPGFAPGWAASGPPRTFTGQDLFNQIDGGAELFLEFGFFRLRLQAYAKGGAELTLNAYEMESAQAALGVYLMKKGRETPFPEIAARNSSEEVQATVLKGRYFIQVDNLGEVPASKAELAALANMFLAGVADEPAPSPLDLLPAAGRVAGSERLIRGPFGLQPYITLGEGDILSLGGRVFGALAEYRVPGGVAFTRLIVPYPGPEAAAAALARLRAGLDPYLKVTAERPEGFDFIDFQARKGSVALSGPNLDLRFNVTD